MVLERDHSEGLGRHEVSEPVLDLVWELLARVDMPPKCPGRSTRFLSRPRYCEGRRGGEAESRGVHDRLLEKESPSLNFFLDSGRLPFWVNTSSDQFHVNTYGWPKSTPAERPLQHSLCALEVVLAENARPPQIYRRLLDVHRPLGRVPICVLYPRHQLSFQRLFSRVRRRHRWLRSLADECRFASSVGQFVLTASLRVQVNPENRSEFKDVSPERSVLTLVHPSCMTNVHVQSIRRLCTGIHRTPLFRIQLSGMNHAHSHTLVVYTITMHHSDHGSKI